ncbi:hypothetical protein ES708_27651 [subsurface metagenome]
MIVLLIIEYILAICLSVIILVLFVPIFFHLQVRKYNDLVLCVKFPVLNPGDKLKGIEKMAAEKVNQTHNLSNVTEDGSLSLGVYPLFICPYFSIPMS